MRTIQTLRYPTVAAFGEWSQTNIGDHAIHEGVREFFGDCGWRVRSFDLGAMRPASGPRPGITAASQHAPPVLDAVPTAKRLLRGWRQQVLMRRLLAQLAGCEAICVGGGALLMDSNLHFPQSLQQLTWAARRLNRPLLCLGCSVEGEWSARGQRIVGNFLQRCDYVAVRDGASAARIAALLERPVPVFGDFAWHMGETRANDTPPRYRLAVNVAHVAADEQQHYEDGLLQAVARVREQWPEKWSVPGRIAVFTTGTAQDLAPATRLCSRLRSLPGSSEMPLDVEMHAGHSLDQLRPLLRGSQVVVATRLHAAILSFAQGVPVVGYSTTPKLGNFFRSVGLEGGHFGPADAPIRIADEVLRLARDGQRFSVSSGAVIHLARQAARDFLISLTQPVRYAGTARR